MPRTALRDSSGIDGNEKWLNDFHLQRSLKKKIEKLMNGCPNSDTGTLAVAQVLANEKPELAAAFAYAVYPVALKGKLPIGKEGVADLGRLATEVMDVNGEVQWHGGSNDPNATHPEFTRLARALAGVSGRRRERALQLFNYLLVKNIGLANPKALEEELNRCISALRFLAA